MARATSSSKKIKEPFAYLPRKVIESEAYRALPDWAIRVLLALACQYNARNNGDLSVTKSNFKRLGVRATWHIHAGLRLLEVVGLITKTRQGGKPPVGCSLYALTWRSIDPSEKFDRPVVVQQRATNEWQKWERPEGWTEYLKQVKWTAKGTAVAVRAGVHVRGAKDPTTLGGGAASTDTQGQRRRISYPPRLFCRGFPLHPSRLAPSRFLGTVGGRLDRSRQVVNEATLVRPRRPPNR